MLIFDLLKSVGGWTRKLGATSCGAFLMAAPVYLILVSSKDYHPYLIFTMFGLVVLGLLSGIAGLISSRGEGRLPIASILGCVLNLPVVIGMLLVFTVMFGHGS